MNVGHHVIQTQCMLMLHHPMHGGQQLQPCRGLKPMNQFRYPVKPCASVGVVGQKCLCVLLCTWYQLQYLARCIATIGIPRNKVPFNGLQYMPKVFGIRAVMRLFELQSQAPCTCMKYINLCSSSSDMVGSSSPLDVAAHQLHQCSPPSRQCGGTTVLREI